MKLSVIIVNFNVKYFLEQCLQSVFNALNNIEGEVLVVDNNSADGSVQMVRDKFPDVICIENKNNVGFSTANNQAIKISKGKYVLLLNPDTLVEEDTFNKCISYMEEKPKAGALGVKMIDGKGNFLPESKRGLPTPWVSFCKIFGLSLVFPRSKIFGGYHLGYLPKEEINPVDVLPGAFMLIRKSVLNETGLLDETFFMYGEDIDLSYRIVKAGYENIYFPESTIIHYKGESTKKGSINYVLVFYNAMIIFAKKHFSKQYASLYSFFINIAIYFRASLSVLKRVAERLFFPVFDAATIYAGFYIIRPYWEIYKFGDGGTYPDFFLNIVVPVYIFIWLITMWFSGSYSHPFKMIKIRRGIIFGSLVIILIYALLPEDLRFSRALIILGSIWTLLFAHIIRLVFNLTKSKKLFTIFKKIKKRILIVGEKNEAQRVYSILKYSHIIPDLAGIVKPDDKIEKGYIGTIDQLSDIIKINNAEEIIFCGKNISSQEIIKNMLLFSDANLDFKIAPPESISVIGSSSINTAGDLYTVSFNSVTKAVNRRKKRALDLSFALLLLSISPVLILLFKSIKTFYINILKIITGKLSFVGYKLVTEKNMEGLTIPGIFYPHDQLKQTYKEPEAIIRLNTEYAQNYSIQNDINIILNNFFKIDQQVDFNLN